MRNTILDIKSFEICVNSGASFCATPDETDFITSTNENLIGVPVIRISGGLKVVSCWSVSWIFQYDKKEHIELIIELFLHITGLPIRIICQQQVEKQTGHIGDGLHAENYEYYLIFGGFRFTKKM